MQGKLPQWLLELKALAFLKKWVNFNARDTLSIRDDFGFSSITDHGVGQYTLNFDGNMSNPNYSVSAFAFRNQSGRVLISLSLDAKGNILNVNLKSSSGFSTLDKAAIKTISKIKSFRPAPFKNENQVHTFILPINYVLKN